ncbi:AAA family ATPase [Psychrobacter glaciei]|uniref:AAA family ATPase n=1 Tax=Psychrobacter glaciei TaxID=619771 RepID=UPI001F06CE7C|nr:AAA family ATPase [Psychrobacter glaciei]MCH1781723.1 ATP-binding protein [Psychrobacter glaciei]
MTVPYKFNIPVESDEPLNIPLEEGSLVFVLGANGVGKSALIHKVYNDNNMRAKRILGNRQVWFHQGISSITASGKKDIEQRIVQSSHGRESRYLDETSSEQITMNFFDLADFENKRARKIANFIYNDDIEGAIKESKIQSPIEDLNEILLLSNMFIQIKLKDDGQLLATKNNSDFYKISELSDGERNALLICAEVLTAEKSQLIIIDEPERHLHRSIISPLLTTLFSKRKDCIFVISTHDIELPINHENCSVVLVRSCIWENKDPRYDERTVKHWEVGLISKVENIPDDFKHSILGSRQNILFVEGEVDSLDQRFYQLLYPELSVIAKGSCTDVINAVNGGNGIDNLFWVKFYGLIDFDGRTKRNLQKLLGQKIAATDEHYSVESLYYHAYIIRKVAEKLSEINGHDVDNLYENATSNIINEFKRHKPKICALLCEKRVKDWITSQLPDYKKILNKKTFNICKDLGEALLEEEKIADTLIDTKDFKGVIARYPIKKTNIIQAITRGLKTNSSTYEEIVRGLILEDPEVKKFYKNLLEDLTRLIESESSMA